MAEQVKFTIHEANLIKHAFREYEKFYGRFTPQERKDLINVKEALVHIHNGGLLSAVQHKIYDKLIGYWVKVKETNEFGKTFEVGKEFKRGKLELVAGKELRTVDEVEHEEEIEVAKVKAEERAKVKEESMKRVAEQEAKVKDEQEKLLAEKKAAHQAEKANVVTGKEPADIDIDSILEDL